MTIGINCFQIGSSLDLFMSVLMVRVDCTLPIGLGQSKYTRTGNMQLLVELVGTRTQL